MTKQKILRRLETVADTQGMVTATQFARFMGIKTADYAEKRFLRGLECIDGKYYLIDDVTEMIMTKKGIKDGGGCDEDD